MKTRGARVLGMLIGGGFLLAHAAPAHATAIALSDINASNLIITTSTIGATINFDPVTLFVAAQAQNSLGELDAQFDGSPNDPAMANAAVTYADGHGIANGAGDASASSSVNLPGTTENAANSMGQGQWFTSFMISCSGPSCGTGTLVNFSADVYGNLSVMTDVYGQLAQTEIAFNLNLDGDPLLFYDQILSIGPNDFQQAFSDSNLSTSRMLLYDTPYSVLLRVDSESLGINTPEPATATLLGLGLGAALAFRRRANEGKGGRG